MNTHEIHVHIHDKFLDGYFKILIMYISGWAGDGEPEICEKETLIFQTFFYTVIFGGGHVNTLYSLHL